MSKRVGQSGEADVSGCVSWGLIRDSKQHQQRHKQQQHTWPTSEVSAARQDILFSYFLPHSGLTFFLPPYSSSSRTCGRQDNSRGLLHKEFFFSFFSFLLLLLLPSRWFPFPQTGILPAATSVFLACCGVVLIPSHGPTLSGPVVQ